MAADSEQDAPNDNRSVPRLLPYLDSAPIQVLIPSTGKKLIGFLLDESADGVAIQLRRTRCLANGDRVQVARNGRLEEAAIKNVVSHGVSSRIGLEWIEPVDDLALAQTVGVRK